MSDTDAPLQATIIYEPSDEKSKASFTEVSQPPVGLVEGTAPRFSDETAALLRRRLKAISLMAVIVLGISVTHNTLEHVSLHRIAGIQAISFLVFFLSYLALRSRLGLSFGQLRLIELVFVCTTSAQLAASEWWILHQFSGADLRVVFMQVFSAFATAILIFGIFLPNTWRRAALTLFPVAFVPYAVVLASDLPSDQQTRLLRVEPISIIAACAAVYGAHTINSTRKAAFKARQFGQYRLKEKLGVGGMGEVYRAEHMLLKRPCVIKLIKQDKNTDASALARFEREVQSTAKLTHWNSVEIFDYGHTEDGVFYYVMEYLPGKSLDDLVKQHGPLPPERTVHFLRQTCRALREAHHFGLVHRDLKPANIFAAKLGGVYDVAKLLDFGLVRQAIADQQEGLNLTQEGSFSGSPLYMPPEQVAAYSEVDGRADIYALGAVAYFLLTGRPPFNGRTSMEVIMAHATKPVVPPSAIVSAVSTDLERVVLRCLEKKPEDRFQDIESLERALAACECADRWTEEKAAQWWDGVDEKLDE